MNERPLVAFTLLSQGAVGGFLALGALDIWSGGSTAGTASAVLFLGVGAVMGVALLLSLLHLGAPRNAWRAAANAGTSWLSREIVFALAFAASETAYALLRVTGSGPATLRTGLAVAASLAGAALVYAMARVYRIRTVPAWDTPYTTLSFFATALLLGGLAVATARALLPGAGEAEGARPLHGILLVAVACLGVGLAAPGRGPAHRARLGLLLLALALCFAMLLTDVRVTALLPVAFAAALAAETLGRYLFYVEGLRKDL